MNGVSPPPLPLMPSSNFFRLIPSKVNSLVYIIIELTVSNVLALASCTLNYLSKTFNCT